MGEGRRADAVSARIAFRPLAEPDLAHLYDWLGRRHVKRWYAPQPRSFAEVAARYRPRTQPESAVKAYIVQADGSDAGYVQAYPIAAFPEYERALGCEKGVAGVDLFLADEWRTGRGLGPEVIRRFVADKVFGRLGAVACVAGPVEGNAASIRAFEKAGFRRWKEAVNERGERECVLRLDAGGDRIATIDLRDFATCAAFARDMYATSFGTTDGLDELMGEDDGRYRQDLEAKLAAWPEANVHLWRAGHIAGQLEMRHLDAEPGIGYVSLLYVLPEDRGSGAAQALHAHAVAASRAAGKQRMRLSVALGNARAIAFYSALGWRMAGAREHRFPMTSMERGVEP